MDIVTFFSIIGALASVYAAYIALVQFIIPRWEERKKQALLKKELSLGLFDEATIKQATLYYIRPRYSNIDPTGEAELRHAPITATGDLFSTVDKFLDDEKDPRRHLLLLADSGTGKTSFILNYYAHNTSRRPPHKLLLVPLGSKNVDKFIEDHPDQRNTVIFLDAFDEDTKAIEDHRQRIRDLMEACEQYRKVIVTCRTQFFPKDEEIPRETGIVRVGPRKAGESAAYVFWKLYLSPFSDDDVKNYLKKRYPFWRRSSRKKAEKIASKIPLLTARPMILAHIPDIISAQSGINTTYQLYDVMVKAWLERETAWVDKKELQEFSEKLAVDLYINREKRGMERISREELNKLATEWGIKLHPWQYSGRSLLNRDAEGNNKFSHRSIMEFLFIRRLRKGDNTCFNKPLTDLMALFLKEAVFLHKSNLSEADLSEANLSEANLSEANLSEANLSGANLSGADLSEAVLSRATLSEAVLSGADLSGAVLSRAKLSGAVLSRAKLSGAVLSEANLSGANLSGADLSEAVLSGANLSGADLSEAVLSRATLSGAVLSRATLSEANLRGANLSRADLSGANLSEADLSRENLSRANLSGANLSGADLSGAVLGEANLSGAVLSEANLSRANLSRAVLSEANLSEADLSRANLSRADLSEANLSEANLSEAVLSRANLSRADLSGANLSEADLSRENLSRANLSGANLSGADLSGAVLSRATLSEANLRGAVLSRADLRWADLRGANLSGAVLGEANLSRANLRRAKLSGAKLFGADLREAVLSGADLSEADLRGAKLWGAYYSAETIWPGEFNPQVKGAKLKE